MAKKQKRQVSRSASVVERPAPSAAAAYPARETPAASRYPVASSRSASAASEFNPDYTHVITDLKRIGVLAGSFIVILVVLSFFLR